MSLAHRAAVVRRLWPASRLQQGQTTVEYVLVAFAFAAIVVALAGLWRAAREGKLLGLALEAGSHSVGSEGMLGALRDVALFLIHRARCS